MEYSTPYLLLKDRYNIYTSNNIMSLLYQEVMDYPKYNDFTHSIKFYVWKHSIKIRFALEILAVFLFVVYFQAKLTVFNVNLNTEIVNIKSWIYNTKKGNLSKLE